MTATDRSETDRSSASTTGPPAAGSSIPATSAAVGTVPEVLTWGAVETARRVRRRDISSREVVETYLARISAVNPVVTALTTVHAEQALRDADDADRRLARGGPTGPLDGLPFTVKDNIDVAGEPTTQGVRALAGAVADADAPAVGHLRRAGAILLARSNMPDLALRWHTDSDVAGPTRNPWDADLTPGGSSGGEAVALATGMTPLGVGTDLGGSLRWPSQCAGTAALRPTLGRIPQARAGDPDPVGLQLLDVTGPMARRVADLRFALRLMSAPDTRDPWHVPVDPHAAPPRPRRVHVLVPDGALDPAVRAGLDSAAAALAADGYVLDERPPPGFDGPPQPGLGEVVDTWAGMMAADARVLWPGAEPLVSADARRFMDAMFALAPDRGPEGNVALFRTRHRLGRAWGEYAETCPLVLAPVFAAPPFRPGADLGGVEAARRIVVALRATLVANLLGLPAVAVPAGLHDGRPAGVQLIGPRFGERACLDAAAVVEAATGPVTPIDPR